MTILEKTGPSTAGSEYEPSKDEYPAEKASYPQEAAELPSYADSTQALTSRAPPPGFPGASNYISMQNGHRKIDGEYTIDSSLDVPSALLPPLPAGTTERPNLLLHTRNGMIEANIALVSGTNQRVNIKLETANGEIEFRMPHRLNSQPFKLNASTRNGEICVYLPRDYAGPLKYQTKNGKIKFSDALQPMTRQLTNEVSFVGDWQAAGFVDYESWKGDEVEVHTSNGKITFKYQDEFGRHQGEEKTFGRGGPFGFGWQHPVHPIHPHHPHPGFPGLPGRGNHWVVGHPSRPPFPMLGRPGLPPFSHMDPYHQPQAGPATDNTNDDSTNGQSSPKRKWFGF